MRGLKLGDVARRQMLWAAFAALWLTAWRTALVLTLATWLTWAACRVCVERRERKARCESRKARRGRSPFGVDLYRADTKNGLPCLVYSGCMEQPFLKRWTVDAEEARRVERARWS